jgi:cytochrome bd-type quinol oxidase subunit 2
MHNTAPLGGKVQLLRRKGLGNEGTGAQLVLLKGGQTAVKLRKRGAIAAIAGMIALLYVFSPIPYLLSADNPSSALPVFQIIIPALTFPLIVLLVFAVPKRVVDREPVSEHTIRDVAEYRFKKRSLISGAVAGLIAACILVGLIFAGDAVLGLPSGTFYSIIGVAMAGLAMPASIYFGVGLHLLTGTLVGATFGYVTAVAGPFNITSTARGALVGVLAGFVTFSLLFIPLTRFEVEPSLLGSLASIYPPGTSDVVLQNKVLDIMSALLAGAILLHVVYGAIMGATTALLLTKLHKKQERVAGSSSASMAG